MVKENIYNRWTEGRKVQKHIGSWYLGREKISPLCAVSIWHPVCPMPDAISLKNARVHE